MRKSGTAKLQWYVQQRYGWYGLISVFVLLTGSRPIRSHSLGSPFWGPDNGVCVWGAITREAGAITRGAGAEEGSGGKEERGEDIYTCIYTAAGGMLFGVSGLLLLLLLLLLMEPSCFNLLVNS